MTSSDTTATDTAAREGTASIGLTGLAVMGRNLARNIARHGHTIAVHNRTTARMTSLVEEFGDEGSFVGSESLEDFVASIRRPRAVIVMVKAGAGTDAVIDELVPLLDEGDIVVDAGNASLHRHRPPREGARRARPALRRHGRLRRRGGRAPGPLDHGPGGSERGLRRSLAPVLDPHRGAGATTDPACTYMGPAAPATTSR